MTLATLQDILDICNELWNEEDTTYTSAWSSTGRLVNILYSSPDIKHLS
jgi:hypothetical protein